MKTSTHKPGNASKTRDGTKRRSRAANPPTRGEFGEGNYEASRNYDRAATEFARSGEVASAARAAAPRSKKEAAEMAQAESEGRARSKGEDPALHLRDFFIDLTNP